MCEIGDGDVVGYLKTTPCLDTSRLAYAIRMHFALAFYGDLFSFMCHPTLP